MIAGLFDPTGETAADVGRALGPGAAERHAGRLRVAWSEPARAHEADGVLAVLDGFLIGSSPRLEDLPGEWRHSGAALAERLRGAFTLVLWDEESQTGMVACDQFSLRVCLMHGTDGGPLRFGTHMPAVRRLLPRDPEPDAGVIAPWIAPHYLQGHRTMLAGVERVGAARLLELDRRGWRRRRYWRPEWRGTIDASWEELVELLRSELQRAIAQRLDGHERSGVILSGGVDSSVVLAIAAGLEPRHEVRAYSTVFPDWPASDESTRIAATIAATGAPAAQFAIRPQGALRLALEQLRDSGTVPGGPGGIVERPGVTQAAADGVGVLLDGQGGDEVFGYSPYLLADRVRRGDLVGAARLVRRTLPGGRWSRVAKAKYAARQLVELGGKPALPARARELLAKASRSEVPPAWLNDRSASALREVHRPWHWLRDERVPRWWAYHEYLLTDHVEGSALGEHIWQRGAPFGIRSGAPLFDVELVELVLRIPPAVKWQRIDRSLARAVVADVLPDVVRLNRVKANIGPFYLDLITGPDSAIMRELLLDPRARVREFADGAWIDRHLPRKPTPAEPDWLMWATVVWRLAMAECWLRWLENPAFAEEQLARADLPELAASRI